MKELKLSSDGVVFSGEEEGNASALYPGVCVMPSGRFIVTFRSASRREATEGVHVAMCISDDGGESWSAAYDFFKDPPAVEGKQGEYVQMYVTPLSSSEAFGTLIWVDTSDPSRPYYNPETSGILNHIPFFTYSDDAGRSWVEPWMMEGVPRPRPMAVTSPTLSLPDGRLCCQVEVHKHHDETGPMFFESAVAFSKDMGKTWGDYTLVNKGEEGGCFFWDQRMNIINGALLGLYWSWDDGKSEYVNARAIYSTAEAQKPLGSCWTEAYDTGIPGQPSQPVLLGDGSVGMAYVERTGAPAIKVRRSFDGGRTWPEDSAVMVYDTEYAKQSNEKGGVNDMWVEMYQFSVGFPVASATPDGGMLVCFYAGEDTDHTAIRWAKLDLLETG